MNWLKWITHTRKTITFFRENHELIKSIVLTVLIALSLVLTWSLWTFKPSLPTLEDARTVKKQEVDVTDQASLSKVVYPTQIVYHKGNELYGVEGNKIVADFHEKLDAAKFYFDPNEPRAKEFNPDDIPMTDMKNSEYLEIVYPVGMSQDVYKEVFSFDTEISASKPQNVDRIFLYQNRSTGNIEGYLVSYMPKKMQKIKSNLTLTSMIKVVKESFGEGGFVPYTFYDTEERTEEGSNEIIRRFYFPQNTVQMYRYTYISRAVNEDTYEKYKKALFTDPLAVKSATTDTNERTFTDGNSAMVINELQNRFKYTNFAGMYDRNISTASSPLFQSIDYINTHAGWGNPYIVSNLTSNTASFWLHVQNLPVLDPEMQMNLEWDENELEVYERSMIQLDLSEQSYPASLSEKVHVASGESVKNELTESEYNENYIQDIRIGYTMKRQNEPHVYRLQPMWFINYVNKGWVPLFKQDREGGY